MELKSYKQAATDFFLEQEKTGTFGAAERRGAEMFAAHLDKNHLGAELAVIALQESRAVDRECMVALIAELGEEKAKEILKPILAKFQR